MFDSTRRSFHMGLATGLGQADPCKEHQDAMSAYARKIAEFSRQMREALARGDKAAADQAANIAQDAGKKYEEHRRMYEKCRSKVNSPPFRPAPTPLPPGPAYRGHPYPVDLPVIPYPFRPAPTPLPPGPAYGEQPYPVDFPVRPYPMRIPFGFGPMFSTGPMAYGGPTT